MVARSMSVPPKAKAPDWGQILEGAGSSALAGVGHSAVGARPCGRADARRLVGRGVIGRDRLHCVVPLRCIT